MGAIFVVIFGDWYKTVALKFNQVFQTKKIPQ